MSGLVRPSYRHVFVVLTVVVSVYFAVRTSDAVLANRTLTRQLRDNQGAVATLEQQNAALSAELTYEQTPAYAEQVAREQLGMMQPGDHVIHVQLAPQAGASAVAASPPAPAVAPPAATKAIATWRRWLLLFTRPPAVIPAAPTGAAHPS